MQEFFGEKRKVWKLRPEGRFPIQGYNNNSIVEEREQVIQKKYYSRVITLRPSTKGGFEVFFQKRKTGEWELPGGKIATTTDKGGNVQYTREKGIECWQETAQFQTNFREKIRCAVAEKYVQEVGYNKNCDSNTQETLSKRILPLGTTSRIQNQKADDAGNVEHITMWYYNIEPSFGRKSLDTSEASNLEHGEWLHFDSLQEFFDYQTIPINSVPTQISCAIRDAFFSELGEENQTGLEKIFRNLSVQMYSQQGIEKFYELFSKRGNLRNTLPSQMWDTDNDKVFVAPQANEIWHHRHPDKNLVTPNDFLNQFIDFTDAEREEWIEHHFLIEECEKSRDEMEKQFDEFIQNEEVRSDITQFLFHTFSIPCNAEMKNTMQNFSNYQDFLTFFKDLNHPSLGFFLLSFRATFTHWKKGLYQAKKKYGEQFLQDMKFLFEEEEDDYGQNSSTFFSRFAFDFKSGVKDLPRGSIKLIKKPEYRGEVTDFFRARVMVPKEMQGEYAKKLCDYLNSNNAPMFGNAKVKGDETTNAQAGERFGEIKILAEYGEDGYRYPIEIQINDADGFRKSESDEFDHLLYQNFAQILTVQNSRYFRDLPPVERKELDEILVEKIHSFKSMRTLDVDEIFARVLKRNDQTGFYVSAKTAAGIHTTNSGGDVYMDFQELFRQRHLLQRTDAEKQIWKEMTEHFNRKVGEKKLDISPEEWLLLFECPFTFFRFQRKKWKKEYTELEGEAKEVSLQEKAEELAKNILTLFAFHVSGESKYFWQQMQDLFPEITKEILDDKKEYRALLVDENTLVHKVRTIDDENSSKAIEKLLGLKREIIALKKKYHIPDGKQYLDQSRKIISSYSS